MQKERSSQHDIRCGQCGRKMAEGTYIVLSIKCPCCRAINHYRASTRTPHASERPTHHQEDANVIFENPNPGH